MKQNKSKLTIAILTILHSAISTANQDAIILLNTEREYLPNTFINNKKEWLGLYCQENSCQLKKINAIVKNSKSQSEGVLGLEDIQLIKFNNSPLAAFQNINNLYEGFVTTSYINTNNTSIPFNKKGYWLLPWKSQSLSIVKRLSTKTQNFRYYLQSAQQKQWLFDTDFRGHYGDTIAPIVTWVGDLDGDHLVDFIIDLGDVDCSFGSMLFLSSMTKTNQLIYKAAEFIGTQPACGC